MSELGERRGRKKLPGEGGRGASTPGLLQVTVTVVVGRLPSSPPITAANIPEPTLGCAPFQELSRD